MTSEFPGEGEELTHILVVSDMDPLPGLLSGRTWGVEFRCFFRDPDGRLLEISEIV